MATPSNGMDPGIMLDEVGSKANQRIWFGSPAEVQQISVSSPQLLGMGLLITALVALIALASRPQGFTPGTIGSTPAAVWMIVWRARDDD